MKILKAIGNFLLEHTAIISVSIFTGLFLLSLFTFRQEPTLQNGIFMILWAIIVLVQAVAHGFGRIAATQHDIQREMAKLRHPSQMFLVDMPRLTADHHERIDKIKNLFPEPKNRDDINEGLRQQFGIYAYPKLTKTDPRMSAKVTGEFPNFKETRDGEVEQDRTIAEPPADEMREPFNWGPGKSRIVDIPTKEALEADLKATKTGGSRFA